MAQKFGNSSSTKLVNSISDNDTLILVTNGGGELFPTLDVDEWMMCTIEDIFGVAEIVKCTVKVGDTFTCTRAQEGTVAVAFASDSRFELRATAGTLEGFLQRDGETIDGGTY